MSNEEAITQYRWLVEKLARGAVKPGVELADLLQEGYCGLLVALREWQGGGTFKAYASVRIREHLRDAFKGMRLVDSSDAFAGVILDASMDEVHEDGSTLHETCGTPATQEAELGDLEQAAVIREAVNLLPPSDRGLLNLWAGEVDTEAGLTHDQIADRMGCSRQLVTLRCGESLSKLGRLLGHRVRVGAPRAA